MLWLLASHSAMHIIVVRADVGLDSGNGLSQLLTCIEYSKTAVCIHCTVAGEICGGILRPESHQSTWIDYDT